MVLTASETRKQARESLKGRWGTVVLITLIFLGYSFLVGLLSAIPFLGFIVAIASIVIDIPIFYGFSITMMKLKRGETVGYFDFFKDGFANFKRAWCITGRLLLKMIVPIILIVVAIFIMGFSIIASLITAFAIGVSTTGSALGDGTIIGISAITIIAYIAPLVNLLFFGKRKVSKRNLSIMPLFYLSRGFRFYPGKRNVSKRNLCIMPLFYSLAVSAFTPEKEM